MKRWLPVLLILAIIASGIWLGLHEQLTLSKIIQHRDYLAAAVEKNLPLALLVYMALYIVLVAVSFPGGLALTVTSGFLFGWFLAGTVTVIAATIGATIIFLVARSSFGSFLEERAGGFVGKMADGFRKDAFQYLLTLRLVPAFPFWVVNIVPGLLNMKLVPYVLATFFGIIPGTFAFAYLGEGLDSLIAEQERANPGCADLGTCTISPKALITADLLLALAALALLSILPFLVKKFAGSGPVEQSGRTGSERPEA